ncbi:MAG: spermidine synthase [Alphaproteobacteria bacterium]
MIPHPAVAVISAAILAYEVLLVRLFAIVQWHHFAYLAISVALLGFGVSGALLAVFKDWAEPRAAAVFTLCATFFAVTAPTAFLLSQSLPFNALEVVWAPSQLLYLGVIYLLLVVPFTAGATCIGLAFLKSVAAPGRVYLWNLLGSGAGALAAMAALSVFAPMTCLALVAAIGLAAAAAGEIGRGRVRGPIAIAGVAVIGAVAWAAAPPAWVALDVSEFKGLTRALAIRDAALARQYSGPLALLSVVESPTVPFRYAPGLSLRAPALPPPQLGIFADGEFAAAIDTWDGQPESLAYLDHSTDALAYHLTGRAEVLVLGAGGGRLVFQAVGHGATRIDAVEINPDMIRLVRDDFADRAGHIYDRPEVRIHAADARRFVTAAERTWDLIQLPLPSGGTVAGARGLNESYLHTVEAFGLVYRRLRPDGWLSVTGSLDLPPRATLKLVATIRSALAGQGVADPARRLLLIRSMTTVTLMVKRGPVSSGDIAATRAFARSRAFDLVHYPGMAREEANRRNRLAQPVFFDAARVLLGSGRDAFIAGYKFDIAPATDDRPYFHDFFKWATLPELLALGPAGGAALLELGELIVAATLVQAIALSLLLVLLPLRARRYRRTQHPMTRRFGAYFTALGVAFLFIEIAYIQKLVLFLGHPLYAVSIALTGFLVFAGLGAGVSAMLERRLGRAGLSAIDAAVAGIAVVSLSYLVALPPLFDRLSGLSGPVRVAFSLALIAPLAFFMGMPFPLGLARVSRADPDLVPWAWGLNGCASVVSAAAATLLTMHLGFSAVVVTAVGLYLLAALALRPGATAG